MRVRGLINAYKNRLIMMRLLYLLRRFGLWLEFYHVHVGRLSDLQGGTRSWQPGLEAYQSGFLVEEDMAEVARCESWLSEEVLLDRLRRGLKCFGVRHKGRIVSYLWCAFEEINCPCFQMTLGENEGHLFNAYTQPEYRGKGLAPFMRHHCYRALGDMGVDTFYSVCDVFNTPSVRYKEKTNTPLYKTGVFLMLGGRFSRNWILREYDYG